MIFVLIHIVIIQVLNGFLVVILCLASLVIRKVVRSVRELRIAQTSSFLPPVSETRIAQTKKELRIRDQTSKDQKRTIQPKKV